MHALNLFEKDMMFAEGEERAREKNENYDKFRTTQNLKFCTFTAPLFVII